MTNNTVIAFIAERKSGKDFLCDYLVANHGATRLSFSDEVRTLAQKVFPWLPFFFSPETKDVPFIHENNPNGFTPREIWLWIGQVRNVQPKYFVQAFEENQKADISKLNIITDFRTEDEYEFLMRHNIPIIKIIREDRTGIPPDDFEQYVRDFDKQDAIFINTMDGTDKFKVFFEEFRKNHGL